MMYWNKTHLIDSVIICSNNKINEVGIFIVMNNYIFIYIYIYV
jgi:hypothetical protein